MKPLDQAFILHGEEQNVRLVIGSIVVALVLGLIYLTFDIPDGLKPIFIFVFIVAFALCLPRTHRALWPRDDVIVQYGKFRYFARRRREEYAVALSSIKSLKYGEEAGAFEEFEKLLFMGSDGNQAEKILFMVSPHLSESQLCKIFAYLEQQGVHIDNSIRERYLYWKKSELTSCDS